MKAFMGNDGRYKGKLRAGSHPDPPWMPGYIMQEIPPAEMHTRPSLPRAIPQVRSSFVAGGEAEEQSY